VKHCLARNQFIAIGRAQGGSIELDYSIVVASVQTLHHDEHLTELINTRPFTLVIIDNEDNAMNKTYQKIMQWVGCFDHVRVIFATDQK
jgi:superfamily II DNA or RNA helicase